MQKVRIKALLEGIIDIFERMRFVPKATLSKEKNNQKQLPVDINQENTALGNKIINM